jgi:steroid delta-isomerase-like uncharacterized protein
VDAGAVGQLVRRFYDDAWNRWDDSVVDGLLAERFEFRGSLGDAVQGRDGWRGYRDKVRSAVPDFHNEIIDLIATDDRAAVRLYCSGHHHGVLLGIPGVGRRIGYAAAAFFKITDGQLADAWVLGDLDDLKGQVVPGPQGS